MKRKVIVLNELICFSQNIGADMIAKKKYCDGDLKNLLDKNSHHNGIKIDTKILVFIANSTNNSRVSNFFGDFRRPPLLTKLINSRQTGVFLSKLL